MRREFCRNRLIAIASDERGKILELADCDQIFTVYMNLNNAHKPTYTNKINLQNTSFKFSLEGGKVAFLQFFLKKTNFLYDIQQTTPRNFYKKKRNCRSVRLKKFFDSKNVSRDPVTVWQLSGRCNMIRNLSVDASRYTVTRFHVNRA